MKVLFLILSLSCITFLYAQSCPSGSIQGLDTSTCYQLISDKKPWMTAEYDCIRRGGHLASVPTSNTNVFLRGAGEDHFHGNFWLGGSTMINPGMWSWSDFSNFTYTNWAASQPVSNIGTYCNYMNLLGGKWSTLDCSSSYPYVCEYNIRQVTTPTPNPSQNCTSACPSGWIGSGITGKCYQFSSNLMTMQQGEQYCKTLNAHLPSVHSSLENQELGKFALNNDAGFGWPWLGITCNNANSCTWTDGTPYNYNATWNADDGTYGTPSPGFPCAVIESNQGYVDNNDWGSLSCSANQPVVCQMTL